jgi:DNA-binding NarL/FixJ family response regulator
MEAPSRGAGRSGIVRVAVADDDALIRRTIAAIVEHEQGLELAGVAPDTPGAVRAALGADVLIADVRMPGGGAVAAARQLRVVGSHAAVIALTGHDSPQERRNLTTGGVAICLVKGCSIAEIVEAIRTAAHASNAASTRLATRSSIRGRARGASPAVAPPA